MDNIYDKDTGLELNPEDIVDGVEETAKRFKAVEIRKKEVSPPDSYYGLNDTTADTPTEKRLRYAYSFTVSTRYKKIPVTAGAISKEIQLTNIRSINLEATIENDDTSEILWYIVDGGTEIPVLPRSQKTVKNERLYPNMGTRFTVDSSMPTVIKKNGVTVSTINDEELTDNVYTVSYTPLNAWDIVPSNNTVRIKLIVNRYGDNAPIISNVGLRKKGRELAWTF